ncbi:MAG: twin-arginine translocase TatA/TatE family subunit [Candidatus Saccharibacteria bacterium]
MLSHFALLDFSTPELIIILAIVLLLFGGKKLPELSRSLNKSLKEIKNAAHEADSLKDDFKSHSKSVEPQ